MKLNELLKDFKNNHYNDYDLSKGYYSNVMDNYRLVEDVIKDNDYKELSTSNILVDYIDYNWSSWYDCHIDLKNRYNDIAFKDIVQLIINDVYDSAKFIDYLAILMDDMDEDDDIYAEYLGYIKDIEDLVIYNLHDLYKKLTSGDWLTC